MGLKEQRAAALKAAGDIIAKAKADSRDLTEEELSEVEAKHAEVERLDGEIEKATKVADLVAKIGALTPAGKVDEPDDAPAKSLGEHFVKSVGGDELTRLKERGGYTVASPEFKADTDPQTTPSVFRVPVLTDVDRTIVHPFRRPVVSDVLGTGSLSGNAITYFVESGPVEGGFATVGEGGQKPQMHIPDPTSVTDALKKIAAWWDTSDEMTEDLDFWVSEINNRAMYLLSLAEENQLLNGDGTGSNINGLLNRSGVQTEAQVADPDTAADALFRAMTKVQTATGLSADALLINPADYQSLRLGKDGNGQYFGGGYFAGEYGNGGLAMQPPVWGLQTIVTAAVPAKTAVVGALKAAATVYRKGGVRVESTNSDLGKFTKNIITTRVEERIALAVRIPAAVVKVTLV